MGYLGFLGVLYAVLAHEGPLLGRRTARQVARHEAEAHVVPSRQLRVAHQAHMRLHVVDGARVLLALHGGVRACGVDDLRARRVLQGDGRRGAVVLLGPHRGRGAHHAGLRDEAVARALFQGRGALEAVLQGRGALKGLWRPLCVVHRVLSDRGARSRVLTTHSAGDMVLVLGAC